MTWSNIDQRYDTLNHFNFFQGKKNISDSHFKENRFKLVWFSTIKIL